jgi:hypothetical protein
LWALRESNVLKIKVPKRDRKAKTKEKEDMKQIRALEKWKKTHK